MRMKGLSIGQPSYVFVERCIDLTSLVFGWCKLRRPVVLPFQDVSSHLNSSPRKEIPPAVGAMEAISAKLATTVE